MAQRNPSFLIPTSVSPRFHPLHANTICPQFPHPYVSFTPRLRYQSVCMRSEAEPPNLGKPPKQNEQQRKLQLSRRQALQIVNAGLGLITFTLLIKMREQFRLLSPRAVLATFGLTNLPVRTQAALASTSPLLEPTPSLLSAAKKHIRNVESQPPYLCPDFPRRADWINSQPLSFQKNLAGKVVLLDFFTYCCINCQHVLPKLAALEQKYGSDGSGGFVVVGVHSAKFSAERDSANVAAAVERYQVQHPVVNDSLMELWNAIGVSSWPTLVLVAPSGRLLALWSGERQEADIDAMIAAALDYYADSIDHRPLPPAPKQTALFGQRTQSSLRYPGKIVLSNDGKTLFVADSGNNRVVQIDVDKGVILRAFGDGESGLRDNADGAKSRFHTPQGIALHAGILFVADTEAHAVRAINLKDGSVSTVGGDGEQGFDYNGGKMGQQQRLSSPWDVEVVGDWLYVAMAGTHQIWRFPLSAVEKVQSGLGVWEVFSGTGRELEKNSTNGRSAAWAQPSHLSASPSGLMYVADSESSSIRAIDISLDSRPTRTIAGGDGLIAENLFAFGDKEGRGAKAKFQHPLAVCFDPTGNRLFVADSYNHRIKVIDSSGLVSDFCGTGKPGFKDGNSKNAMFWEPAGLALSPNGKVLYVADTNNFVIRTVDTSSGEVKTIQVKENKKGISTGSAKPLIPFRRRAVFISVDDVNPTSKVKFSINLPAKAHFTDGTVSRYQVNLKQKSEEGEMEILDSGVVTPSAKTTGEFSVDLSKAKALPESSDAIEVEALTYYCTENDNVCRVESNIFTMALSAQGSTNSVTHFIKSKGTVSQS